MAKKITIKKKHTVQYDSLSPEFCEIRKHHYIKLQTEADFSIFIEKFNKTKSQFSNILNASYTLDEEYIKKVNDDYDFAIKEYNKRSLIMKILFIFSKPTNKYHAWYLPSYEVLSNDLYIWINDISENLEKLNYELIPEDFYLKIMKS